MDLWCPYHILQEENHPFVVAMSEFLEECDVRARRPPLVNQMMTATTAKFEYNMTLMQDIARGSMSSL